MGKEYILCAAVWYKDFPHIKNEEVPLDRYLPKNCDTGVVFMGLRHGQCIYAKSAVTGLRDCEAGKSVQGFLTNLNRFVDREEGAKIFIDNGGILKYSKTKLYSEDLY